MLYSSLSLYPVCEPLFDICPPCGCFKCALLWFIPGHFSCGGSCRSCSRAKKNTPNHKMQPEMRDTSPESVFFSIVLVFFPSFKYAVCIGEGHLSKQMSCIQETERGRREGWLISLWYAKSHIHTFTGMYTHTHTQTTTHTHTSSYRLCCSVTLY